MERIKIQHKTQIAYQRTAQGIIDLAQKIQEANIPKEATVDWRNWNAAEFLWSTNNDGDQI